MARNLDKIVLGWDYGRALPPDLWEHRYPDAAGVRQSPIELATTDAATATAGPGQPPAPASIEMRYRTFALRPEYESLHISVAAEGDAGAITVQSASGEQDEYLLSSFHLHTPAEHVLDGVRCPMEVHFVHIREIPDGEVDIAVVAVLLDEGGPENPLIAEVVKGLPPREPADAPAGEGGPALLLPAEGDYLAYAGSLTTPPCTENVTFFVLARPVRVAKAQIAALRKYAPRGNNRPLQPRNGRAVWGVPGTASGTPK